MVWTIEPFSAESCDIWDTVCRENTGARRVRALIFPRETACARRAGPNRPRRKRLVIRDSGLDTGETIVRDGLRQARGGGTVEGRVAAGSATAWTVSRCRILGQ